MATRHFWSYEGPWVSREQNGAVYPTVAGLLMAGKVLSSRRFVPTAVVSLQVLADALKGVGLAEKTRRGIDGIFKGALIYGGGFPDYSNTTSAVVSLLIPRSEPDAQLTKMIAEEHNRLGCPLPVNMLLC